ncbi:hypothetical protein LY76DRAFT_77320 [Colletotrichum caudatum]|nr:hypothetical protein LY76DRAFT_77320 [Colletotrichum caudatum]
MDGRRRGGNQGRDGAPFLYLISTTVRLYYNSILLADVPIFQKKRRGGDDRSPQKCDLVPPAPSARRRRGCASLLVCTWAFLLCTDRHTHTHTPLKSKWREFLVYNLPRPPLLFRGASLERTAGTRGVPLSP